MQRAAAITLATVSVWTIGGLWLDSVVGARGQLALGLLTAVVLAALLVLQTPAVRVLALGVVVIATLGEVVGSLIWGLYGYRLDNLPAFVPPGHGLVYLAGLSLATLCAGRGGLLLVVASAAACVWGLAGLGLLPALDLAGAIGCAFLVVVFAYTRRPVYAGVFVVVAAARAVRHRARHVDVAVDGAGPRARPGEPAERRRERLRRVRRRRAVAHGSCERGAPSCSAPVRPACFSASASARATMKLIPSRRAISTRIPLRVLRRLVETLRGYPRRRRVCEGALVHSPGFAEDTHRCEQGGRHGSSTRDGDQLDLDDELRGRDQDRASTARTRRFATSRAPGSRSSTCASRTARSPSTR